MRDLFKLLGSLAGILLGAVLYIGFIGLVVGGAGAVAVAVFRALVG